MIITLKMIGIIAISSAIASWLGIAIAELIKMRSRSAIVEVKNELIGMLEKYQADNIRVNLNTMQNNQIYHFDLRVQKGEGGEDEDDPEGSSLDSDSDDSDGL